MGRWLLGAALCLALAGAALAEDLPHDKIKSFSEGHTTKAEVLASLGQPERQSQGPDGVTALGYPYTIPLTEKNKTIRDILVVLVFDAHDVLLGKKVLAKNGEGAAQPSAPPTRESAQPMSSLRDENVLTPLPTGFGVGAEGDNGPLHTAELIPVGETVQDWTRMITQQTFHGHRSEDPSKWPISLSAAWKRACPGGAAEEVSKGAQNGYPSSLWRYVCPLNPATKKPETMWMKTISGGDALYTVQYAYRRALGGDMETQATGYLTTVSVCDTRTTAHPCPH